jgi:hypothetical protein
MLRRTILGNSRSIRPSCTRRVCTTALRWAHHNSDRMAAAQEVLALNQKLLSAIGAGDYATYEVRSKCRAHDGLRLPPIYVSGRLGMPYAGPGSSHYVMCYMSHVTCKRGQNSPSTGWYVPSPSRYVARLPALFECVP